MINESKTKIYQITVALVTGVQHLVPDPFWLLGLLEYGGAVDLVTGRFLASVRLCRLGP